VAHWLAGHDFGRRQCVRLTAGTDYLIAVCANNTTSVVAVVFDTNGSGNLDNILQGSEAPADSLGTGHSFNWQLFLRRAAKLYDHDQHRQFHHQQG
jgi:hypothetical protein